MATKLLGSWSGWQSWPARCDAELTRKMSGLGALGRFEKQSLGLMLVSILDDVGCAL
jgi:hypothetical protein